MDSKNYLYFLLNSEHVSSSNLTKSLKGLYNTSESKTAKYHIMSNNACKA